MSQKKNHFKKTEEHGSMFIPKLAACSTRNEPLKVGTAPPMLATSIPALWEQSSYGVMGRHLRVLRCDGDLLIKYFAFFMGKILNSVLNFTLAAAFGHLNGIIILQPRQNKCLDTQCCFSVLLWVMLLLVLVILLRQITVKKIPQCSYKKSN